MTAAELLAELRLHADPTIAAHSQGFFKTQPGGYGEGDRKLLRRLARSRSLWEQRIAVLATLAFIREHQFADTFELADLLLHHEHDLMHKAVGWMLREVGNRDRAVAEAFLATRYREMPRTMLRYAIEKFPEGLRQRYLRGTV